MPHGDSPITIWDSYNNIKKTATTHEKTQLQRRTMHFTTGGF
jgi:hypothetical protein